MERTDAIPDDLLQEYRLVPLSSTDDVLRVGTDDRLPDAVREDLAFLTGKTVECVDVDTERVNAFLREHDLLDDAGAAGDGAAPEAGEAAEPAGRTRALDEGFLSEPLGRGSVVQQVDRIIHRGVEEGASDIHIEPYEDFFRVRYRLDGVLHTVGELDLDQRDAMVSRLKIMADLDIAEKRRPQDSRIRIEHDDRTIDLRVSTLPTAHGEKVVLRILDKSALKLDLGALGFDPEDRERFEAAIQSPNGQILVTGPTGSGKTTTLYAALNALNDEAVNVTTIEDPIEYNLQGINQTLARSDIGFTFAQALRAFLRQDPDVIMVGEIRDKETADIAVRAALTGHLVLSTLHTNDAPSTVTRLTDMGVEPYLVAGSVRLVVAQRLVRTVCPNCRTRGEADPAALEKLGLDSGTEVVRGEGCEACNQTGFQGRSALFEIMPVTNALADLVSRGASTSEERRQAKEDGMRTLRDAGAEKVRQGETTPSEVFREVVA